MKIQPRKLVAIGGLLASLIAPSAAFAAGYELLEQSANGVGQAFAGSSTGFGDGSEVYFNPGALTNLPGSLASAHIHLITPRADFNNEGSGYIPQLGGGALSGDNGGDGGDLAAVPNLYVVWKATNDVTAGLGINSPFGLKTEYNDDWVGRYHAIESSLTTVNINPAIGVKLDETLSVGVGLQIMHADAKLTNAIDFGTVGASNLPPAAAKALGLFPQSSDGFGEVEGDDWGMGVGVGGVYSPTKSIRMGVNWRSKIDFTLDGDADFTVPANAQPLTSTGLFTDTDAQAELTLPESINFGIAADIDPALTVYADGAWTKWDRFQELRVTYDSVQPDTVQDESWENTWRASVGAKYKVDDAWTFRTGVTWDESPVPDAERRTPRIPDGDRFWLALGLSYAMTKDTSLGINYAHIFVSDEETFLPNNTGGVLNGSWDLGVDIASFSITTAL